MKPDSISDASHQSGILFQLLTPGRESNIVTFFAMALAVFGTGCHHGSPFGSAAWTWSIVTILIARFLF